MIGCRAVHSCRKFQILRWQDYIMLFFFSFLISKTLGDDSFSNSKLSSLSHRRTVDNVDMNVFDDDNDDNNNNDDVVVKSSSMFSSSSSSSSSLRSLLVILPFSMHGMAIEYSRRDNIHPSRLLRGNVGFSHLAAAIMAMDHFNNRNPIVVPQLASLKQQQMNCTEYFNITGTEVADSQASVTSTLNAVLHKAFTQTIPDAIIDGYYFHEEPSLQLRVVADSLQIPHVSSGGLDTTVVKQLSKDKMAFSSRVYSDIFALADATISYLQYIERDIYVGTLHSIDPTSVQIHEAIQQRFIDSKIQSYSSNFAPPSFVFVNRTVENALSNLFTTGFRTIVMILHDFLSEIRMIAKAITSLGINKSDYVWIIVGDFDVEVFDHWNGIMMDDPDTMDLLSGAAVIQPLDNFMMDGILNEEEENDDKKDKFLTAWSQQGPDFVNLVNSINSLNANDVGYFDAPSDYFQRLEPGIGAGFVYDAVIATGLGFCVAQEQQQLYKQQQQELPVELDVKEVEISVAKTLRIRSFDGATGHVAFNSGSEYYPGSRTSHWINFAVFNLLQPTKQQDLQIRSGVQGRLQNAALTHILKGTEDPNKRKWESIRPFVYADGTTYPPELLRTLPEQNYLKKSSRVWGFVLFSISMLINVLTMIWVHVYRNHHVIKAAQPEFLQVVILGSMLFTAAIIPNSFDESYGWDIDRLGKACTSAPWLVVIGFIFMYSALWCKLWRINKVLQFSKRKVAIYSVIGPASFLFLIAICGLSVWTTLEGFDWVRIEIDEYTGESYGKCQGQHSIEYFTPIFLVMIIPPALTGIMAWHARDIDPLYSETRWIFAMIIVQFQLLFITIPLLYLIDAKSNDIRYVGQCSIFAIFSLSTTMLLLGPKVCWIHFAYSSSSSSSSSLKMKSNRSTIRGGSNGSSRTSVIGNNRSSVHISGLDFNINTPTTSDKMTLVSRPFSSPTLSTDIGNHETNNDENTFLTKQEERNNIISDDISHADVEKEITVIQQRLNVDNIIKTCKTADDISFRSRERAPSETSSRMSTNEEDDYPSR